jgi:glycosidase
MGEVMSQGSPSSVGGGARARGWEAWVLLAALTVCEAATGCKADEPAVSSAPSGPGWHRKVVFYELWVRTYQDSDGDGIGDLDGLASRLDHLRDLGVGAIWLMPIYPSPLKDSGYDVSDYEAIHAEYGTLEAFDRLIRAAHARNIKIMMDLVFNHTSSEHAWFEDSRKDPEGAKGDYYVWASTAGLSCKESSGVFGTERWTLDSVRKQYYFHQFYPPQPDLNFRSSSVQEELLSVARFWLDRGVDGFRLDVAHAYVENLPSCLHQKETYAFHKKLRAAVDEYEGRAMVGEVFGDAKDVFRYLGDGSDSLHLVFYFEAWTALWGAVSGGDASTLKSTIAAALKLTPAEASFGLFLGNHDVFRISSMVGTKPESLKMAASLQLLLPGAPFVYYGEEIGMTAGTTINIDFRDGSRTPMQWDDTASAGFTDGTPWLTLAGSSPRPSVASERGQSDSILEHYRRLIALRNRTPALQDGGYEEQKTSDPALYVFKRTSDSGDRLVVLNLSSTADKQLALDLGSFAGGGGTSLVDELSGESKGELASGRFTATLPARTAWVLK